MSVNKVNKANGTTTLLAGSTLWADSPIGTILAYGGTSAPIGWMLCQGQAISRTTYAELFAVIGTSFGTGDGSTTFNIPDLRGEFLRGAGANSHSGQGNGGSVGQHQDATVIVPPVSADSYADIYSCRGVYGFDNSDVDTNIPLTGFSRINVSKNSGGGAGGAVTRPTNTSVNYIIKIEQVALPADLEAQVDDAVAEKLSWTLIERVYSSSGYQTTFTIPNSYNELLVVCGTPYYQFSDVIPKSIMDDNVQYSGYHQTGFTGSSMSQQYCYTLNKNGNFTAPTVVQNGADNTGFFALYYR